MKTIREIAGALREPLGFGIGFDRLYEIVMGESVPSYTPYGEDYKVFASTLADLLDRCVELPLDREGVPIRPGDEVSCNGDVVRVGRISLFGADEWMVVIENGSATRHLDYVSHVLPDSFERIVDDALGWQATEENREELLRRCREVAGR